MHDDAYIGGRSENNIKCIVHDDLRWKNQTTRYILLHHWLYKWFSQFHSCGTCSVLSQSPSVTQLILEDSCTRSNHNFKFWSISSNSDTIQILLHSFIHIKLSYMPYVARITNRRRILHMNNSYPESPPIHDHRSHVSRCVQAPASIAPP